MSQNQFASNLRRELSELNTIIDRKIVRGRDYKREAARHKAVLRALSQLRQQQSFSLNLFSFFF